MDADRVMYRWRRMTPEQRQQALHDRQQRRVPWHGPPHYESDIATYMISAACYDHQPIIGESPARMGDFELALLGECHKSCPSVFGWIVLPNHYHLLVHAPDVKRLLADLGRLHGRMSYHWNGEETCRGRQVWHRAVETAMKSEGHFWASLNYVLHNAVRHGYVEHWQDWPYSNAAQYLADVGRNEAERRWRAYPLLNYGDDWDPPEL